MSVPTMESATWWRTPAAASAARRLRPEVSKNSSTALFSNEGEFARSTTTCAPATASLSPSPVTALMPPLGDAATTSWPPWRRMATAFEPIRPVPPITTTFMLDPPLRAGDRFVNGFEKAGFECPRMLRLVVLQQLAIFLDVACHKLLQHLRRMLVGVRRHRRQ